MCAAPLERRAPSFALFPIQLLPARSASATGFLFSSAVASMLPGLEALRAAANDLNAVDETAPPADAPAARPRNRAPAKPSSARGFAQPGGVPQSIRTGAAVNTNRTTFLARRITRHGRTRLHTNRQRQRNMRETRMKCFTQFWKGSRRAMRTATTIERRQDHTYHQT